jgi:hypothetical protein
LNPNIKLPKTCYTQQLVNKRANPINNRIYNQIYKFNKKEATTEDRNQIQKLVIQRGIELKQLNINIKPYKYDSV